MCLPWGMNWVFISQKTAFFLSTAVNTSDLTPCGRHIPEYSTLHCHFHKKIRGNKIHWNVLYVYIYIYARIITTFSVLKLNRSFERLFVHVFGSKNKSYIWSRTKNKQTNSVALSPQANYTDWATTNCRRNLVSNFADSVVLRGQRGGSPTVINLSFLDRSHYFSFK
jgi:hypothetical protein